MTKDPALPAFAKINLSLRIRNRRSDGYHDLDTIFQTINLHDAFKITVTDNSEIALSCDDRQLPVDSENLIVRAARALQDRFSVKKGARIRLEKRIPARAGLGGGSSDAAVTLLALARFWGTAATRQILIEIGAELGADVPFFFTGGMARGTGIGDRVEPLPDMPERSLLIIKPVANINTADAYKVFDERCLTTGNSKSILSGSQPIDVFDNKTLASLNNDFEQVVFELQPEIAMAKAALMGAGAQAAMLAGSGSAVFGIFDSEDAQRRAIQAIELETGWRVFPCKTIGRDNYRNAFGDLRQLLA
ncbi:MAG TPA: 4-(cytidine 5'-diphospho)-2-C-methyl-D-erythritol kinase [Pyrinomonadaceae bacterium]|nr:4-(cytidine 5'-diphospho)-2-C-methyl-D-erythritol kinase [Pyrinomonadaceae bacterium]